jgi:hypothetical protein
MPENPKAVDVSVTQADAGPHPTPDQERAAAKRRAALAAANGEHAARSEAPRGRTATKPLETGD